MVEIASWIMSTVIALFAVVGFLCVVATGSLLAARRLATPRAAHHTHLKTAVRAG